MSWFASDGLMRLELTDSQPNPYAGGQETVLNENGILYKGIYFWLLKKHGKLTALNEADFIETYMYLEREPGLICRMHNNYARHDAQDNQIGSMLGALACGAQEIPKRINAYGEAHGYNYNNVDPGRWKLEQQRQGGDIALFKIAAGEVPTPWEYLWLIIGILINICAPPVAYRDQTNWCRVEILKHKEKLIPLCALWSWSHANKYQDTNVFEHYYKPGHPIIEESKWKPIS